MANTNLQSVLQEIYTPESADDCNDSEELGMTSIFGGYLLTPDETTALAATLLQHAATARRAIAAPSDDYAARPVNGTLPNPELRYPLSEWVLYLIHGDMSAVYQNHPAGTDLAVANIGVHCGTCGETHPDTEGRPA